MKKDKNRKTVYRVNESFVPKRSKRIPLFENYISDKYATKLDNTCSYVLTQDLTTPDGELIASAGMKLTYVDDVCMITTPGISEPQPTDKGYFLDSDGGQYHPEVLLSNGIVDVVEPSADYGEVLSNIVTECKKAAMKSGKAVHESVAYTLRKLDRVKVAEKKHIMEAIGVAKSLKLTKVVEEAEEILENGDGDGNEPEIKIEELSNEPLVTEDAMVEALKESDLTEEEQQEVVGVVHTAIEKSEEDGITLGELVQAIVAEEPDLDAEKTMDVIEIAVDDVVLSDENLEAYQVSESAKKALRKKTFESMKGKYRVSKKIFEHKKSKK